MDRLLTCYEKEYIQKNCIGNNFSFEVDTKFFWIRCAEENLFLTRTYQDQKPGLHAIEPSDRKQVRGKGKSPIQKAIWRL